MDHLISARQEDRVRVKKKEITCQIVNFAVPADHREKLKECKKRNNYLDLVRQEKNMEHESDGDTNCNWRVRHNHKGIIITGTGGFGNKRTIGDHPNYSIVILFTNPSAREGYETILSGV